MRYFLATTIGRTHAIPEKRGRDGATACGKKLVKPERVEPVAKDFVDCCWDVDCNACWRILTRENR